jgi:hypothetical protein
VKTLAWTVLRLVGRPVRASVLFMVRAISPEIRIELTDTSDAKVNTEWVAALCLVTSIALSMVALGQVAGRSGKTWGSPVFWAGICLLFFPVAMRLVQPMVSRLERVILLILLALSTFGVKLLYSPTRLVQFDEFLHWRTASDIMASHRLFLDNSLLPVSPLYPGLEILTTALAFLTHLSVFGASLTVLVVLRGLFVCVLYSFYQKLCGSSRVAAIACVAYMGNSGYVLFDALFAYETLAIVLLALALLAEAGSGAAITLFSPSTAILFFFVLALAVTHHMTGVFAALVLSLLALLHLFRPVARQDRTRAALVAGGALALMAIWSFVIGNPIVNYLGPVFQEGAQGFFHAVSKGKGARQAFVSADGTRTPILLQVAGMGAVGIVALMLATGFFRSIALATAGGSRTGWRTLANLFRSRWSSSRLILLTILTLGWPLSIVLRLTPGGWEIGNRMGPYVYFGVSIVMAISLVYFWETILGRLGPFLTALTLSVAFVGGVVTGWGVLAAGSPYKVEADSSSVEPMGIKAALWSRKWLGTSNRFATDRINQLLVATYGRQEVVNALSGGIDTSYLFVSENVSSDSIQALKEGEIDYLLVDLRISMARPALGTYFGPGEDEEVHLRPPNPSFLLKFDDVDLVSRVFTDGWIVIFDVRALRDAH